MCLSSKNLRRPCGWLIRILLLFASTLNCHAAETLPCKSLGPLTFGILPFISAEQLVDRFSPLSHYLQNRLQVPVRIETAPNFMKFAQRTHQQQRYDILFTAPHFYPQAHSKAGYRLVAGVDSPGMRAIIVVPENSEIKSIEDLKNKHIATPHHMSLASLLIKRHLNQHQLEPGSDVTLVVTPTHDASLLSAYHGVTDASSLMRPPFEAASKQLRDSMRIITETESSPHIPISVSPRVSEACEAAITSALLNMDKTDDGRKALKHNRFNGFKQANADDYELIRSQLLH